MVSMLACRRETSTFWWIIWRVGTGQKNNRISSVGAVYDRPFFGGIRQETRGHRPRLQKPTQQSAESIRRQRPLTACRGHCIDTSAWYVRGPANAVSWHGSHDRKSAAAPPCSRLRRLFRLTG